MTEERKTEIYNEYHRKVMGYLYNRIGNREAAEDMTTDIFLKVFGKIDTFDESKSSLSTWIFTITRNTLTDWFRTRRVMDEIPETVPDGSDVEEGVLNAEMLDLLASALEGLDQRLRDIIVLHYYTGLTLKEVAVKIGISYAYVKQLHNRALAELREKIE